MLFYFYSHWFVVIKAERVSNDSVNEGYVFPDQNDNLTAYDGGIAQLMISSRLLQNIGKCNWHNIYNALEIPIIFRPNFLYPVVEIFAGKIFSEFDNF